jgi:hypothetical protein
MRHEKSFLPLASQQKYNHSHRVSLFSTHTASHEAGITDERASDDAGPADQ